MEVDKEQTIHKAKCVCQAAVETDDKSIFITWLNKHNECLAAYYEMKGMVQTVREKVKSRVLDELCVFEDEMDIEAAKAAKSEGPSIPYEDVRKELGFDD